MNAAPGGRSRARDLLALAVAALVPVPWMLVSRFSGLALDASTVAVLSGMAILGAAFLLAWATELAERDIPQALAILLLALISVLPEYAIDLHFAWTAGKDPTYAPYAVANMTGANRLLIGLGWAVVVLVHCWRAKTNVLEIHPRQSLEMRFLIWATIYSFFIPLTGTLNLFDAFVLFAIFFLYAASAMRSDSEEVELVGPPALLARSFGDRGRRGWAIGLFVFAAWGIFISAEPFAESLVEIGRTRHIDEFLLVQWVAPLASESPEFLIATLFALRLRGSVGIGALISSKVNQWTLLVGAIPIAFALSAGSWNGLPLDERQTEELILTSSQSLLAAIMICDLRFSRLEAIGLALLFSGQFLFTETEVRYVFIAAYLLLSLLFLATSATRRRCFVALLKWQPDAGARS
jgi:cation:H+ antiporter